MKVALWVALALASWWLFGTLAQAGGWWWLLALPVGGAAGISTEATWRTWRDGSEGQKDADKGGAPASG